MNVNELKLKLESVDRLERLSGIKYAISESQMLAVYVIKDYISREKDETIMISMIIACAKIGGESEIDFIGSFLNNDSYQIKKYAFQALALIESDKIFPYIFKLLTEEDVRFKQLAISEIRKLGKKKSLEIIQSLLVSEIEWHRKVGFSVLEMLNNIIFENELVDILSAAVLSNNSKASHESLLKLKKYAESGSGYAVECLRRIKDRKNEELNTIINEIIKEDGVSNNNPTAAVESKGHEVVKETEKTITEFSDYVDSVVKISKKTASRPISSRPAGAAEKEIQKHGRLGKLFYYFYYYLAAPFGRILFKLRYVAALFVIILICGYMYLFPENWMGKGEFVELSSITQASLESKLKNSGLLLSKKGDGSFYAYRHTHWTDFMNAAELLVGQEIIFSAYEVSIQNTEIYTAKIYLNKYEELKSISDVKNITQTSSADENEIINMKNSFAYLSNGGDSIKILTIQDGDWANKRQFLFKGDLKINKIENSALAINLIRVEAQKGKNKSNVSLNVDSGNIDPPDFPVEYIPATDAEEPFIPRLVEKVRNLNFVGPEKIAKLEDFYYGTVDYLRRTLSTYEEEESLRAEKIAEKEALSEKIAANDNADKITVEDNKLNAGSMEISVAAKTSPENAAEKKTVDPNSGYSINIVPPLAFYNKFEIIMPQIESSAKNLAAAETLVAEAGSGSIEINLKTGEIMALGTKEITAPAGETSSEVNMAAAVINAASAEVLMPAKIESIFKKNAMKNEGVWEACDFGVNDGRNYIYKTKIRVDLKRPFAVMNVIVIDLSQVDMHVVAGTEEPVSTNGLRGKGKIPDLIQNDANLICAFNGGFRTKHGSWGFISDGVEYLKPSNGVATVAVNDKGIVKFGNWGFSMDTKETYVHLRQNLPPLVENSKVNDKNKYWGFSIDNKTNVWRSALGITKDGRYLVYGAGNSLSFETLGAGMIMAGCSFAMQLDINDYHTYFFGYNPKESKNGTYKYKPQPLCDEMSGDNYRCLKPYTRDFFYLTWKNKKVQTAAKVDNIETN
ncbi:MAG: hypothetical protein QMC67_12775 [Candidatus Wallbacteria bacterium]